MNKLTLVFGALMCLVVVNARHFADINDGEALEDEENMRRPKEHNIQARHRKRRWQMNYGYDYPPPSYQYPDRRNYDRNDYDRNNQELQQITRLLEEISAYIRRPPPPPPPPQPIYVPYPVYFNFPQIPNAPPCNTKNGTGTDGSLPGLGKRTDFKDMDPNQNWGLVVSNENDYDDGTDGSRPISFDPIVPKLLMKRPTPKVEHGSVQATIQSRATTQAPRFQDSPSSLAAASVPGMCNAAILSCCGMSKDKVQQSQCFSNIGCNESFADGDACTSQSIQNALKSFQVAYSPVQ